MNKETGSEVLALREKLRILEDKDAIRELKAQYAYTLDAYDIEAFLDLFIEDAAWESRKGKVQGKAAIRANTEQMVKIMPFFAHMYVSPVIEILSETEAKGKWYMFEPETLKVRDEDRAVWVCSRYEEEYVKVNGKWKYRTVKLTTLFQTSFDKGWVKERIIL